MVHDLLSVCGLSPKDHLLGEELRRTNDTVSDLSNTLAVEQQQRAKAECERDSLMTELVSSCTSMNLSL